MLHVGCYSGVRYSQRPVSITFDEDAPFDIRVAAEWRTPLGWRFLVKDDQQRSFLLAYNEAADVWEIETQCSIDEKTSAVQDRH